MDPASRSIHSSSCIGPRFGICALGRRPILYLARRRDSFTRPAQIPQHARRRGPELRFSSKTRSRTTHQAGETVTGSNDNIAFDPAFRASRQDCDRAACGAGTVSLVCEAQIFVDGRGYHPSSVRISRDTEGRGFSFFALLGSLRAPDRQSALQSRFMVTLSAGWCLIRSGRPRNSAQSASGAGRAAPGRHGLDIER